MAKKGDCFQKFKRNFGSLSGLLKEENSSGRLKVPRIETEEWFKYKKTQKRKRF